MHSSLRALGNKVKDDVEFASKPSSMLQKIQQVPRSTSNQNFGSNLCCNNYSLVEAKLQQQIKHLEDSLAKIHGSNLRGILGSSTNLVVGSKQGCGDSLFIHPLNGPLRQNLEYFHNSQACRIPHMDANLELNNSTNVVHRKPITGSSYLEVKHSETILADSAKAGLERIGHLSSMLQDNCRAMSQVGTKSNPYRVNTQLMTLHDNQWNKNRFAHALGTDHASRAAMDIIQFQEYRNQFTAKRNETILSNTLLLGPRHSVVPDLKAPSCIVKQEDADNSNACMKSRQRVRSFPVKLMTAILQSPDEDIIAWLSDGKSFVVVNPNDFVNTILRRTFKECKYASFVRKLHRWGFIRLTSGNGTDCFHHPLFQKHKPELCSKLKCTPRDQLKGSTNGKTAAKTTSTDKRTSLSSVDKVVQEYSRR